MKKVILLSAIFLVLAMVMQAQVALDPNQYVNIQIGADTLSDGTHDPAKTVYTAASGQIYAFDGTLYIDFDLTIIGSDDTWIYDQTTPPIFLQRPATELRMMFNLRDGGSITISNVLMGALLGDDTNIYTFIENAAGYKVVVDNCVFTDHDSHAIKITGAADEVSVTNCIFINGVRRRWNAFGGMPIRIDGAVDQILLENNTVVNSARLLGNGGNFFKSNLIELHNTYVNQQINAHELYWYTALQANNIFYNWSWRGRKPSTNAYETYFTTAETFANVESKTDSIALYHGRNLLYLDPSFLSLYENDLAADTIMQCLLWNVEVDSTVEADENFTIGKNYWQIDPGFTTVPDNIDSMMSWVEGFWSDPQPTDAPDWRITPPVTYDGDGNVVFSWPPAFDLSYSNTDMQASGTDGLPLGDLNWFPDKKTVYEANRDTYIAALQDSMVNATSVYIPGDSASAVLDVLVGVKPIDSGIPNSYSLSSNYPNPFNPTTVINFSIPQSGLVTLKVYNILGQEVRTIVNKEMSAGTYKVDFNASDLSSGVYIYTIKSGSFTASKKMMLLK